MKKLIVYCSLFLIGFYLPGQDTVLFDSLRVERFGIHHHELSLVLSIDLQNGLIKDEMNSEIIVLSDSIATELKLRLAEAIKIADDSTSWTRLRIIGFGNGEEQQSFRFGFTNDSDEIDQLEKLLILSTILREK